jgi:tetratricopeptide (TPR) repeat protein
MGGNRSRRDHGNPDRSDAAGILRQSRPRPRRQWRLCARDLWLWRSDQDPSEAKFLTNRGDAYQAKKDYDRAIADYDAALKLDPKFQRAYNNRGAAWVKKGDRSRALQDYAEAVRLNPSDSTAAANHKDIAQEIERLGSLSYQKNLPSFNCATAKRQVEKAICADPGLAQLDRNINDVFLRVIASAESDSHRAALALTRQQRDFIEKRNSSFGKRGYDLRQAMEDRLEKLNTIARQ